MSEKLTKQDFAILSACNDQPEPSSRIGARARIKARLLNEAAARHLIKLTRLGLTEKFGTRMFPEWAITPAGRRALAQQEARNG